MFWEGEKEISSFLRPTHHNSSGDCDLCLRQILIIYYICFNNFYGTFKFVAHFLKDFTGNDLASWKDEEISTLICFCGRPQQKSGFCFDIAICQEVEQSSYANQVWPATQDLMPACSVQNS